MPLTPLEFTFQYVSIKTLTICAFLEKEPNLHSNMFLLRPAPPPPPPPTPSSFTFQYVSIKTIRLFEGQ